MMPEVVWKRNDISTLYILVYMYNRISAKKLRKL